MITSSSGTTQDSKPEQATNMFVEKYRLFSSKNNKNYMQLKIYVNVV
jgi:hypothetical protein